jgi:antitoxin PrlF
MAKLSLCSDSTLTNRYQTTIPEMVRKVLHLNKCDKIRFTLQADGTVLISRADQDENDPVLDSFLTFLANDISQNPKNVSSIGPDLIERIRPLISGVEIDLNSPLSDEDD